MSRMKMRRIKNVQNYVRNDGLKINVSNNRRIGADKKAGELQC